MQSGTVALADLRQGDCLLSNKYVDVRMLQAVPCREYHKIEVVARYQLHNTDPSSAAAQQESLERCQGAFGVYAPRAVSDPNLHGTGPATDDRPGQALQVSHLLGLRRVPPAPGVHQGLTSVHCVQARDHVRKGVIGDQLAPKRP